MNTDQVARSVDPSRDEHVPEISAFISHERSYRNFVISLAPALDERRVPVRGDWQLTPGEDWWERIADLIRGSDTFLFLLTPESVRSPACLRELNLALSWRKRILPVVRQKPDSSAIAELPDVLAKEQWVFLRPEDDLAAALDSVVKAVRTDFELAILHTRLALWTDAWEKGVGDLLRGAYLTEATAALKKMDEREPLLPSTTAKMKLFVEESLAAARRRKRRIALTAVVTTIIVALLGWIAWEKKRLAESESKRAADQAKIAHLEQLKRSGESAVTAVRSDDVPGAVALLEDVVGKDAVGDLPAYHLLHRFLRVLLTPPSEAMAKLSRPSVFRWRGKQFVLLQDGRFLLLPGPAVELFAVARHGDYLLTTDVARSVCIVNLQKFATVQCFPVSDARIEAIYENADSGALAVVASELYMASDEDDPNAQAVGGTFMVLFPQPDAKPQSISVEQFASTACGEKKNEPCGFRRLATAAEPNVVSLTFPRIRAESEYWSGVQARSSVVPLEWRVGATEQSALDQTRYARLNFSGARYSGDNAGARIADSDELLGHTFFGLDGSTYVTGDLVEGNQWVRRYVCSFQAESKVSECWSKSKTAVSTVLFAPTFRYLVSWSEEVEYGFQVLAVPTLQRCGDVEGPGERAVGGAFSPDGMHLSVLSLDGELWIYSVGAGCKITLLRRSFSPQLAIWAAAARKKPGAAAEPLGISFVNQQNIVVARGNKEIIAFDATTGLLKWSRPGFDSFGTGGALSATVSPDGSLLAAWTAKEIQLMHMGTGVSLSSTVGVSGPNPIPSGEINRVAWKGDSVVVEWADPRAEKTPRTLMRRLSPSEAETQFLHSVGTAALVTLTPLQE